MTTVAERIVALLPRHEAKEISMADIARIIGVPNGNVMTDMARLIEAGVVFKICRGRYRLTGKRWISGRERYADLVAGRVAAPEVAAQQIAEREFLLAKDGDEIARLRAEKAEANRIKKEAAVAKAREAIASRKAARQSAKEEAERRRIAKLEREAPFGFSYPASATENAMRRDHDRKLFHVLERRAA